MNSLVPSVFKKSLRTLLLSTSLGLALGCAEAETPQNTSPLPEVDPIHRENQPLWPVVQNLKSADKSISLEKREMPEQEQQRIRDEMKATDLLSIPIESKFNVSLFKIQNVPEYDDALFIAPRLYAYSSADGARLAPRRNSDGTMSISFPVVLTPGNASTIQSPNATDKIRLPDFLLIQDLEELTEKIKSRHGAQKFVAPLNGCPKRITVAVNNEEYDATPSDLAKSDYCEQNTPFTVTVRMPEDQALYLLQDALYAGVVDVRAVYETRVAYSSSRFKLEFEKSKLFEELSAALSVKAGWADVDVRAKTTEIVQRQAMKVQIRGEMSAPLQTIVEQAIQSFFTPFRADPDTLQKECSGQPVCLRLNYNYSKETNSFVVEWLQSSNVLTGKTYTAWTKLKALEDSAVRIEKLSNTSHGFGSTRETGLTVIPKDVLSITPLNVEEEVRELELIRTERQSNPVCLYMLPVFETVCKTRCHGGRDPDCNEWCKEEIVGTKCGGYVDLWTDTTHFSMGAPSFKTRDLPVGKYPEFFDALTLKFVTQRSNGQKQEVSCPLSAFAKRGDGKSLQVTLENRPGCPIFTGERDESPMLYLVNSLNSPKTYRSGRHVVNRENKVLETPVMQTYSPEFLLTAELAIRGASIGSASSGGQKN